MKRIVLLLVMPLAVGAQTTINGGRIFKGTLDASGAASTLPYRTGTGSPVGRDTCGKPGESYFQTDAPAGQNVWGCTASGTPGTWNQLSAGATVATGTTAPGGSCSAGALYVRTDMRQFYICSAANVWQLGSYGSDVLANRPASCAAGQVFLATDAGALSFCSTPGNPGTWQAVGGALASVFGRTGAVTAQVGDYTAAQVTNAAQTNAGNTFTAGTQDFSGAGHTLPAKVGATASKPATCTVGEMYFATDATAGQNWYYCTAANTWAAQSVPAAGVPSVFGRTGAVMAQTGDYTAAQVTNAAQTNAGNTFTAGTQDFSGAGHTLPAKVGATASKPGTCTVGEMYFATDATAGQNWYYCTAANTWTAQSVPAAAVPSVFGRTGAVTAQAGDYTAAQVTNAAQTNAGNTFTTGTQNFSGAAHTLPAKVGTAATRPATCTQGEMYFATDAAAGQNWYYCIASNTWTAQTFPAAPVPTVFGRSGAITAQSGDYTAAQVTNAAQTSAGNSFTVGTQDFSGAGHTLPAKVGTTASKPATCTQGEMYFATDAAAGQNWYYCTASNTWTAQTFPAAPVTTVFGRTGSITAQAGDYTAAQVGALNDPGSNGIVKRTAANSTGVAVAGDFPTLNQNTTGTAANVTGIVAEANGGTGTNNTVGAAGHVLRSNGTHYVDSAIQAADVPTLNQSTAGNAATATALASAPTQCTGGQFATGVAASGNANCSTPAGGGNASITATTVSFSATPTFARSTNIQEFILTLSGNVTSSTLTGAVGNDILIFQICQDSAGGRTFAWPGGFGLAASISSTANSCTRQQFLWDGANANPSAPATSTDTPFLISGAQERAVPATPGSGIASLWPDSTRHTWSSVENGSSNVHIMPRTAGGGDQLASMDLSDSANLARITTSNTFNAGTQDFSAAGHTLPAVKGTAASKPGTCTIGEMYFATDATAGQNFYYCTATNTWTQQLNGGGTVSSVFGRTGAVVAASGDYTAAQVTNAAATNASNTFTAGTQDFSGAAHTLPALKGTAASKPATCTLGEQYFATDATAGQNLYFCTATNTWTQQPGGGGGNTTLSTQGSGYVMPFGFMAYNVAQATLGPNTTYVYQFVCCWGGVGITVRNIRIGISGAPSSSTARLGIYADSSGSPGALLASTNTASSASVAYVSFPFATPYTLTQGTVYWVALTDDTSGFGWYGSGSDTSTVLAETSHPRGGLCTNPSAGTGGSLTLAANCGALTGGLNSTGQPVMAFLP